MSSMFPISLILLISRFSPIYTKIPLVPLLFTRIPLPTISPHLLLSTPNQMKLLKKSKARVSSIRLVEKNLFLSLVSLFSASIYFDWGIKILVCIQTANAEQWLRCSTPAPVPWAPASCPTINSCSSAFFSHSSIHLLTYIHTYIYV